MTQPDEFDQLVKELREYRSFCEAHGAYTEEHEICDRAADAIQALRDALASTPATPAQMGEGKFKMGDRVRKTKGSSWQGRIVGFYSTDLTAEGYAVESEREPGSVQIYPAAALARVSLETGGTSHAE